MATNAQKKTILTIVEQEVGKHNLTSADVLAEVGATSLSLYAIFENMERHLDIKITAGADDIKTVQELFDLVP